MEGASGSSSTLRKVHGPLLGPLLSPRPPPQVCTRRLTATTTKVNYSQFDALYKIIIFRDAEIENQQSRETVWGHYQKASLNTYDLILEHGDTFLFNVQIPKSLTGFEKPAYLLAWKLYVVNL